MANENSKSGGIGFLGLLFLVFFVLKVTHQLTWSWWWITAPLWAPIALLGLGLTIYFLIMLAKNGWPKKKS